MKSLPSIRCLFYCNSVVAAAPTIQSFSTQTHPVKKNKKTKEKVEKHLNEVTSSNSKNTLRTSQQIRELAASNLRRLLQRQKKSNSLGRGHKDAIELLSEQQREILRAVTQGRSVFITGSAGTGKSFLLNHVITVLQLIHGPEHVFVTASTGVAAFALEGQTIHSFAGVGLGIGDRESLLLTAESNRLTHERWKRANALVIDEVSMISGELFDNLEFIARNLRSEGNDQIWGGIQLVVAGDFFQLPPIKPSNPAKEFAFEADCWDASFDLQVALTHIFRQSDAQLIDVLQGIRRGLRSPNHIELLNRCCCKGRAALNEEDSVTQLFPLSQDVERVNEDRLKRLGGKIITYRAIDSGEQTWKNQLQRGIAPEELDLCLGARVMLIQNKAVDRGLVNGATGTIVKFVKWKKDTIVGMCDEDLLPKVRFDSGPEIMVTPHWWDLVSGDKLLAERCQIPLILAWALSIHKCQGMTLDCVHTDLSRAFGCGMVYVALSRVRHLSGLHLSGFDPKKIMAHPKVLWFYQRFPDG